MTLPKVLIKHTLDWEHSQTTYRLIAAEALWGGVEYIPEKLDGQDAMGQERWIPIEPTEYSLMLCTIGQALLTGLSEYVPPRLKSESDLGVLRAEEL